MLIVLVSLQFIVYSAKFLLLCQLLQLSLLLLLALLILAIIVSAYLSYMLNVYTVQI